MQYLIAIDLDDTLLNGQGQISEASKKYLMNLDKNKYKVILSSGRPYSGMASFYMDLNLDTPVISNNGTVVFNPSDSTFKPILHEIKIDDFKRLFCMVTPFISSALYNLGINTYVYNLTPKLKVFIHATKDGKIYEGLLNEICNKPPRGAIFIVNTIDCISFENAVSSIDYLGCRCWGKDKKNSIYELFIKCVSKATGLKYLMDYYNIDQNHLIAFGDGQNDLEMLKLAKYGIAMKNGDLKNIMPLVTEYTNNEDGVIKYLDKIIKNPLI